MDPSVKNSTIRNLLIKWYNVYKRDLPWRNTTDPYIIWISEIILQQTRVNQGYDYFVRFTSQLPDVRSLATADEQDVLKLWQGLGYYSRARNLHYAAKDIQDRFGGEFPTEYKDVLSLKGVGEYTAAAIVSFAYNMPYATVDGNVYRVLSRLYAIDEPIDSGKGKKLFAQLAQELLNKEDPGIHNQAMMEFGALQCVPVNPVCGDCPLSGHCLAYASGIVKELPVKQGKTVVKERYFNYLDIRYKNNIYLHKRSGNDVWKKLYELPLIETDRKLTLEQLQLTPEFQRLFNDAGTVTIKGTPIELKHVLSHRIIYATFYEIEIENDAEIGQLYTKTSLEEVHRYPISRLVDRYFEINEGNASQLFR